MGIFYSLINSETNFWMIFMNNQNKKQLEVSEILSYFEKENLRIPKTLAENFNRFCHTIEMLKGYKLHLNNIFDKKTFYFQQLDEFLQYISDIKTFYLDLQRIYQDIAEDHSKISIIANDASSLVNKIPYLAELKTSITGDYVRNEKYSHFYVINHQELIGFLSNVKDLVKPVDTYDIQNSPISDKLIEIINIIPSIKSEYLPDVVFSKVPESIERIIILSEDLKKLNKPFIYLKKFGFLKELMELVSNDFHKIENYFKVNPHKNLIKFKGKFRKAYSNLRKLYLAISFDKYLYL